MKKVQKIRQQLHRMTCSGRTSMFSGRVFCADCGSKMNYGSTNNYKPQQAFFDCSVHWKDKEKCGTHYIRESVLERNQKRIAELKRLFIKICEDNTAGRLSDERFDMMSQSYEVEQKQLEVVQQEIEVQERQHRLHSSGCAYERKNGVTEVTPLPENTKFSGYFEFYCFTATVSFGGRISVFLRSFLFCLENPVCNRWLRKFKACMIDKKAALWYDTDIKS